MQFVNEAIERTARLTGQSAEEVAKGIPRGRPLYDAGGGIIGAGTILGALGLSNRSEASSLPGGVTMPSMASIRESVAQEQQSQSAGNVNDILNFLDPAFIMPQALGGGVDTMDGYLQSQTR